MHPLPLETFVLQACFDGMLMHFVTLAGDKLCQLSASAGDRLAGIQERLLCSGITAGLRVEVVLPGGVLMSQILSEDPEALVGSRADVRGAEPCTETCS